MIKVFEVFEVIYSDNKIINLKIIFIHLLYSLKQIRHPVHREIYFSSTFEENLCKESHSVAEQKFHRIINSHALFILAHVRDVTANSRAATTFHACLDNSPESGAYTNKFIQSRRSSSTVNQFEQGQIHGA